MAVEKGWTVDTLKEYLEGQIASLDRFVQEARADDHRALKIRADAQLEALRLARQEMDSRLEKLAEMREALSDAQSLLMPRQEAKLLIDALVARVEAIQKGVTDLSTVIASLRSGLSGQNEGISNAQISADRTRNLVFAVLGIVMVVIGVAITLFLGLR